MNPRIARILQSFVGLSLVAGGIGLLVGGLASGTLRDPPTWAVLLVATWVVLLFLLAVVSVRRRWPWALPAGAFLGSFLILILWARLDPTGHTVLAGFAPYVAFGTGFGILYRHTWAWPVALASVSGFGPIVLLLAPLPDATVASGFVLFLLDAIALLALHEVFFGPREGAGPAGGRRAWEWSDRFKSMKR